MGETRRLLPAVPVAWTVALSVLLLGPALLPGYVLTYDMVWVPDLALRPDLLGTGSGLPRAVPSDAVVALLDEVVPGMLLQKLVLLGSLVVGGLGAVRLTSHLGIGARCVAASLYVWNPFTVERLLMGHWPVLLGYAVLPWLVVAAGSFRRTGRLPAALVCLLPLGCLSASAGLATSVAVLAFGLRRGPARRTLLLLALVVCANLPWVVSGLLHAGAATSDPAAARLFALRGEGLLPEPLTALGLGGVWNAETVPATREGVLGAVGLLALLLLVAAGLPGWLRAVGRRDAAAYVVCWALGFAVAVLSWAAPGAIGWLAAEVPGGGLLRDGSRLLGLCAPLLVTVGAHGAARVAAWFAEGWQRRFVTAVLVLVPLALMPDAAAGVSGRLEAVAFPASYAGAREAVGDAGGADVLVLPFSSYRAPAWNDGRKVLDPVGRHLEPDYVASDVLVVSDVEISGEDPRGEQVRRALAEPGAGARAEALADLGVGVVVRDLTAPGPAPDVAGTETFRSEDLVVTAVADPVPRAAPAGWRLAMGVAWALWLLPVGLVGVRRAVMTRRSATRR